MNTTGLFARIRRALTTPAAVPETGPKLKTNLDTDLLKLIAIAAMLIDHIGGAFFPEVGAFRWIGRVAFPIFCYCMTVGLLYTRDVKRYLGRLAVFALIDAAMLMFLFLPGPAKRLLYGCIALAVRVCPRLDRAALEAKADAHIAEYRRGAQLLRKAPGLLAWVLGLSALQLACSYAMPYVVYRAFGLSGFSLWEAVALQALCSIAVGYLPLPGSAGAAENVFLRGFLLIFGEALVAPAMILSRTLSCYLVLIATAAVLAVGRALRRGQAVPAGEPEGVPDAPKGPAVKRAAPAEGCPHRA